MKTLKWLTLIIILISFDIYAVKLPDIKTEKLNGVELVQTNQYLTENDFPDSANHNGNLFGWRAGTNEGDNFVTVYGGQDLTEEGSTSLTTGTDQLGNTTAHVFDGTNDWLSNSGHNRFRSCL